jgi:hypothetical protein
VARFEWRGEASVFFGDGGTFALAVLRRREAEVLAKQAAEVEGVFVADGFGDVSDGVFGAVEQFAGALHTQAGEKVDGGGAGLFAEEGAKVGDGEVGAFCEFTELVLFGGVRAHVGDDIEDAVLGAAGFSAG